MSLFYAFSSDSIGIPFVPMLTFLMRIHFIAVFKCVLAIFAFICIFTGVLCHMFLRQKKEC